MRLVHEPAGGGDAERLDEAEAERPDEADAARLDEADAGRLDEVDAGRPGDGDADAARPDAHDDSRELASTVETADSLLSQARGLMFRRSVPDDYALAFRFAAAKTRDVHMVFVFVPLDVVWVVDDVVQRVERLRPWRGYARERADLIVELPAGGADGVEPGDRVVLLE